VRRRAAKRRRQLLLITTLIAALICGVFLISRVLDAVDGTSWESIGVEEGTFSAISVLAETDARAERILNHPGKYPAPLLDLLAKNSETLDFVLDYPKHHKDPPAKKLSESLKDVPLLLQWDERWGYQPYGNSIIAVSGCAPTCLAMAASYLTGNKEITPRSIAKYSEQQGYYIPGKGTSWTLFNESTGEFGVSTHELPLDENTINSTLDLGGLVICSMKPGDFTDNGHFVLITSHSENGYTIHDPNSRLRSGKIWTYTTISTQINNLWACQLL